MFVVWRLQTFERQFVTVFYSLLCGKVWLSFVVQSAYAKPDNEERTHNCRRVGENSGPILSRL